MVREIIEVVIEESKIELVEKIKKMIYMPNDQKLRIKVIQSQRSSRKNIMLEYNKNYATLVFNYMLKNSKRTLNNILKGIYE